jgi:2-dehydropantoate 2-reductase
MYFKTCAVIGTGALGGYYGSRLQQAGMEVHFLLHRDYNHVHRHGLRIESVDGDFALPRVNAYQNAADMPPCDVTLVALKATQNHLLPKLLPSPAKNGGIVVVLQNGLGVDEAAAQIIGPEKVVGGLCFICANKVGPGHIHHLDYGRITLGEYSANQQPGGLTDRLYCLQADFEQAAIPITLTADLLEARWKKLVWNIPFNGLSVALNASTVEMITQPHTRAIVVALMNETLTAAAAVHQRHISSGFIDEMVSATEQMKPYQPSMKLDFDASRPLEVEAIYGQALRLAQQVGLDVPRLEMLYHQLKFLNERRITGKNL